MYGSLFVVLSTAQLFGVAANPEIAKEGTPKARPAANNDQADLSGYYTCKGQEAGGKNYSGIVVLTKKNEVYLIQWVVGGGSNFSGIAIRQGDNLAASWAIASDRGLLRGVNLYRVESTSSGPRLVGRWSSVPGPGVQQTETLSFLKKLDTEDD
jgi:hypothetical protein